MSGTCSPYLSYTIFSLFAMPLTTSSVRVFDSIVTFLPLHSEQSFSLLRPFPPHVGQCYYIYIFMKPMSYTTVTTP
jgi:hypothetical protein